MNEFTCLHHINSTMIIIIIHSICIFRAITKFQWNGHAKKWSIFGLLVNNEHIPAATGNDIHQLKPNLLFDIEMSIYVYQIAESWKQKEPIAEAVWLNSLYILRDCCFLWQSMQFGFWLIGEWFRCFWL